MILKDNVPVSRSRVAHLRVYHLAIASVVPAALHGIAWDFECPTAVERILWRAATVAVAARLLLGLLTSYLA